MPQDAKDGVGNTVRSGCTVLAGLERVRKFCQVNRPDDGEILLI